MEYDFSEENSKTELMLSALTHYTEKLRTIMVDPELGQYRTDYLKEDLVNEMMFAEKVRIRIREQGFNFDSVGGSKPGLNDESERNVIISALQSYLNDLQESKNTVVKKLGSSPNLKKLDHEVKILGEFLDKILEKYPEKK